LEDKNDDVALLFLIIFAARGGAEDAAAETLCIIISAPLPLEDRDDELRIVILIRRRGRFLPSDVVAVAFFPSRDETLLLIIIVTPFVAFNERPLCEEKEEEVEKPWWLRW